MRTEVLLAELVDVAPGELTAWIERGWVRPDTGEAGWEFLAIDVARARLIHDLRRHMDVEEETVPLVLSLIDQIYALRAQLRHSLARRPDDRSSMS